MRSIIEFEFNEHLKTVQATLESIGSSIETAANLCINSLENGGKILVFGNGGSAADSQHFSAELVGRYKTEREGLPAIALTTDTSIITAVGNDYGYETIFSRQVMALAKKGDILIGISTSGNSSNVINGLKIAKELGCKSIGLNGGDGGVMGAICDVCLTTSSKDTARIQETHILIIHILCELIENKYKKLI